MPYAESDIRDYVRANWRFYGPKGIGWRSVEACVWNYSKNNEAFARDLHAVDSYIRRSNEGWSIDDSEWPIGYGNDDLAARREEIAKYERRRMAEAEAAYFAELMAAGIRRMLGGS